MRTTAEECRAIGAWIAAKLNACRRPGPLPDPRARRLGARRRRRRLPRPGRRRRPLRRARGGRPRRPPTAGSSACRSTSTTPTSPTRSSPPSASITPRRLIMPAIPRAEILKQFHALIDAGKPIIGGGAGTGLSAKCEEAGGIDLIVIYNSGRYRMAGRGSAAGLLAFGNANEIVKEMAAEVLPVVQHTPVLAGVNGTDPFLLLDPFLRELKRLGFSGVQNFPTIGLFDGTMRTCFEETGMGYGLEVDMIAAAHAPRPPDHALRLHPRRGARDDPRRRRHHRRAHGGDHRRRHRRHLGQDARRLRRRDRRHRRRRPRRARRRHRPLPRRPDRRARRRRLHPEARPRPATASTAPPRWSACRSSGRSPNRPAPSRRSARA